ncbi:hypothetical protein D9M71_345800 [compost metagenome]
MDQRLDVVADVVVLQAALELLQFFQAADAVHGVDDAQQVVDVAAEGLEVGEDVTDGVVDLVGDAGGELADGGELFRLLQLGIGLFQLVDQLLLLQLLVAQGVEGCRQLPVGASELGGVVEQQAEAAFIPAVERKEQGALQAQRRYLAFGAVGQLDQVRVFAPVGVSMLSLVAGPGQHLAEAWRIGFGKDAHQWLVQGLAQGLATALADEGVPMKDAQVAVEEDDAHLDMLNQGTGKIQRAAFHDIARFFCYGTVGWVEFWRLSGFVVRSVCQISGVRMLSKNAGQTVEISFSLEVRVDHGAGEKGRDTGPL